MSVYCSKDIFAKKMFVISLVFVLVTFFLLHKIMPLLSLFSGTLFVFAWTVFLLVVVCTLYSMFLEFVKPSGQSTLHGDMETLSQRIGKMCVKLVPTLFMSGCAALAVLIIMVFYSKVISYL